MKKIFFHILLAIAVVGILPSCEEKEDVSKPILGLGGETWPKGPIDVWITENLTKPYNIDVKYRWDGAELAADRTLVPVKEEKVIPVMETVMQAWIDVYTTEVGEIFIKKYAPKQYVLVGSPQYNSSGTITLGEAEGGRKVTLFRVNDFDKSNRAIVKPMLKTIHHEFAHILHQNVMYPSEYQQITPSGYTSDWNNIPEAAARAAGYITPYAQSSPNEDFVEMVAIMLTEGKAGYEAIVRGITNANAVAALRRKEQLVVTYFRQVWKIDFYRLQNRSINAINKLTSEVPLTTYLGSDKAYTAVIVDPNTLQGLSEDFLTVYNEAYAGLYNINPTARFTLNNISLLFNANNEVVLRVSYSPTAGAASGTTSTANFTYKMETAVNGNTTFTYVNRDNNANAIAPGIAALTNYLTSNTFRFNWYYSNDLQFEYGGLTSVANPDSYFFGVLN